MKWLMFPEVVRGRLHIFIFKNRFFGFEYERPWPKSWGYKVSILVTSSNNMVKHNLCDCKYKYAANYFYYSDLGMVTQQMFNKWSTDIYLYFATFKHYYCLLL